MMLQYCNTANYNNSADWNSLNGNLTTVGTNGKSSYYGTYDQDGNISELLDTRDGQNCKIRGGDFALSSIGKSVVSFQYFDAKINSIGFRVAKKTSHSDYVEIGDPNNPSDSGSLGSVSSTFFIKKYPVTNSEYVEFLNSIYTSYTIDKKVNLWISEMSNSTNLQERGGIVRSGSFGSYSYSVIANMGNKPVNYIDWFCAARYINWLHNGKPTGGSPGPSVTEDGVYTLDNYITSESTPNSKPLANNYNSFWLPRENEWYKSAYYSPIKAGYWNYATQSDSAPTAVSATSIGDGTGDPGLLNCVTPTVTSTNTPTRSTTPTVTATPTITASASNTVTPSITQTKTPTLSITSTKTPTPTKTNIPTRTPTKSVTKTLTITPTTTPTNTITPTITPTVSVTKTSTITPSKTTIGSIRIGQLIYQNNVYNGNDLSIYYKRYNFIGKVFPDVCILKEPPNATLPSTRTPTPTPSHTTTNTPTSTITATKTPTNTPTNSPTPFNTVTPSTTITATNTLTPTRTSTNTPTPSITHTNTPTPSITQTNTSTPTISLTSSKTATPTNTVTPSITVSSSNTQTPTPTNTRTPTITVTATNTLTPTASPSPTVTATSTNTATPTNSVTPTNTVTPTPTKLPVLSNAVISAQNNNKVAISSDNGTSWSSSNLATTSNNTWSTICYGNGILLTVAYNTSIINYSSDNGVTWSAFDMSAYTSGISTEWISSAYDSTNDIFIITSYNSSNIMRLKFFNGNIVSVDTKTLPSLANWSSIAYGNGTLLALAGNATTNIYAVSTNGGITWTQRTLPTSKDWRIIEFLNNIFITISFASYGGTPVVLTSSDSISWSSYTGGVGQSSVNSIAYANSIYLSAGSSGAYKSTDNGASWSSVTLPFSVFAGALVLSKNNTFIVAGNGQTGCATSVNGTTWTIRTLPFTATWYDAAY